MKSFVAIIFVGFFVLGSSALNICDGRADGTRLSHPEDCAKFVVCKAERVERIDGCNRGLHFNARRGECDFAIVAGCELTVPEPGLHKDSRTPDDSCCSCCCNCCDSPTPAPESTPVPDSTPDPGSTPGPSTGPSGTTCVSNGKCNGQPDGAMFSVDHSPRSYIVCQCECEIEMPCPEGLVYNETLKMCDWA